MDDQAKPQIASEAPESEDVRNKRMEIIEAFSHIVKEKRKTFIDGRRASGIEEIWSEDEEHYQGVDDANRATTKTLKGRNMSDGMREQIPERKNRSTVFLKITRPYVDAAAARVSDMLLPTDERNFMIEAGKVPELTAMLQDARPAGPDGKPLIAPPMAEQPPQQPQGGLMAGIKRMFTPGQGVPPAAPPTQPKTVADIAAETIAKAKKSAERAQQEIDDWLTECSYHAEVRKVIESAAKVGTGILKGPHPTLHKSRAAKQENGIWSVQMVEKIRPESKWVSHWNFYPDPACGDNIQKGSGTFECDDITARALMDLKKTPGYIPEMIDLCLEEGPTSPTDGTRKLKEGEKVSEKDLFQIWYFHGQVSKLDMEAAGCKCGEKNTYPCVVTMVNDRVIRVTLSPLDSGEFPYDVMVWQAQADHWAGVGVARQMRECQKGANAAVRNLMDNAGLSAGPQIIVNRNKVVPANGRFELTPRKVWYSKGDEDIDDVAKAFIIVSIETRQAELMAILQFWLKEAEDVTGLPMLLQGQQGSAPDTVGGMQIMNNNGSTVLRRIARTFDDRVTEPHIGRYYEWLLLYGPDDAKGDFIIDARGSSALVERDLQAQQLVQIVAMSANPIYGLDPELVMKEFLKSMRFNPEDLELSAQKKQEMAQRQPPEDPRVTAAKIMAKTKEDALVAGVQTRKMELDHETKEGALDRDLEKWLGTITAQLGVANLSAEERQHLEDVKATMTGLAMKLNVQKDLFVGGAMLGEHQRKNPSPQVTKPAAEPAQRAPAGEAFTQ